MHDDELDELLAEYAERLDDGDKIAPEAFAARRSVDDPAALHALARLRDAAHALAAVGEATGAAPRTIGPYRVVGVLGRGGAGVVFRAVRPERPAEFVALKILGFPAAQSARAQARFRREAAALARIDHPGVVRVLDSGESPEGAYMAMELVEGRSLADHRPADAAASAALVRALADAVAAIHAKGVVHRDLKPGNVVLRADSSPVVLDFGLAFAEGETTVTGTGDVMGTPRYMAPEQARGEEAGFAADVYALGAVLHELATGAPPHGATGRTETLELLRREPAPRCLAAAPATPPGLAAVIDRALEFDPTRRYQSAAALRDDLDAWLAGRPTVARPPSTVDLFRRLVRRRRRALALSGVACAAAIAAAVLTLALAEDPLDAAEPARRLEAASVAWLDGDSPLAKSEASRAAALDPDSGAVRFLAVATGGSSASEVADPAYRALSEGLRRLDAGDEEGAFKFLERAAALAPDAPLIAHGLGRAAAKTERPDLAVRAFSRAARLLPASKRAALDLGAALEERKEHAEAARTYAASLEREPEDGDLWYRLAKAQYYAGEFDAALVSAGNALARLGEKGLHVYVLYGVLLDRNGRRAEARAAYDEVLRRRPRHTRALYNKGVSFDSEHEVVEALALYREAHAADPRDVRAMIALANLLAGASEEICEGCREAYADHPECRDDSEAREFLFKILDRTRGGDRATTEFVANTARKAGAEAAVLLKIEGLLAARRAESDAASRTAAIGHLERAAKELRRAASRPKAPPR